MIRVPVSLLTLVLAAALGGQTRAASTAVAQGGSMRILTCSLGCESGWGSTQVSCGITEIWRNDEVRIRFSRPVDPATLTASTLNIIDVGSGNSPGGTRFVDPGDPQTVVFRPTFSIDANGDPVFGFEPLRTYRIEVRGVSHGDPPPYIQSDDADHLPNRTRMACDVVVPHAFFPPGVAFCAGDGWDPEVTTRCPCANSGFPGRGCANSTPGSHGARLFALGAISPDTVALYSTSMPATALTVFLQGSQSVSTGLTFGDGVRCVSGTLVRLGVQSAAGGVAAYPGPADPSITLRSAARGDPIAPGTVRNYQGWYRDGDPAFCASPQGGDGNVTNAVRITW